MLKKKVSSVPGAEITTVKNPDFIKLTTLQLIKKLLIEKWLLRRNDQYSLVNGSLELVEPPSIKVYHLAVVLDDKVVEVMRAQEKLADILTANPQFIIYDAVNEHIHPGKTEVINGKFETLGLKSE